MARANIGNQISDPGVTPAAQAAITGGTLMKRSILLALWLAFLLPTQAQVATRTEDVIYGRKHGTALTLDILRPPNTNGYAVIWVVSGGWFSSHDSINADYVAPLLKRGYTVFAVVHGSQPKFTISEIGSDMHRAVRFIRHNAGRYGIAADKIGVTGASAGGHLSLTLGTRGGPGDPRAKDPIDRESSAVQCVACFFPPTDFLNYNQEGDDAVGVGTLKDFKPAFGAKTSTPEERRALGREISPIYFVNSNSPPVLIAHGDADKLVPISQAKRFLARCDEFKVPNELIVHEGAQHGWAGMDRDLEKFADWFDRYLRGLKPAP
jgi:acetyl esterase/lipase